MIWLDIRQIEGFFWIATLGSFGAAAKRLFITQPAISSRVLALEQELGVTLFDRTGRQLKLTRAGLELLDSARSVLELMAKMRQVASLGHEVRGVVRLGVVHTIAHTLLAPITKELDRRHPKLDFDLQVGITATLDAMLVRHELDLVIGVNRVSSLGIVSERLGSSTVEWVASADAPFAEMAVSLVDILPHRVMTYARGTALHQLVGEAFRTRGFWPVRLSGSNSVAAMLEFARNGIGVCVLPTMVVAPYVVRKELRLLRTEVVFPAVDFFVSYAVHPLNEFAALVADVALSITKSAVKAEVDTPLARS